MRDYSAVLELEGGYTVAELLVEAEDWIAGRRLADATLRDEGVVVLGVHHPNGGYVGAPDGDTVLRSGDILTVYGRQERVAELDARSRGSAGDAAHVSAVTEQARVEAEEDERERVG